MTEMVESCLVLISDICTSTNLNLLMFGLYEIIIDMDWVASNKNKIGFYNKLLEYLGDEGEERKLQGITKPIAIRKISILQVKRCSRKGCTLYAVQVTKESNNNKVGM